MIFEAQSKQTLDIVQKNYWWISIEKTHNQRKNYSIQESHCAKDVKGGPLCFLTSILLQNNKKIEW